MKDITNTKEMNYPTEITFKAIFRNRSCTMDSIRGILAEEELSAAVTSTPSSGGKFISYTTTAVFASEESLQRVCGRISSLEGYMTMF